MRPLIFALSFFLLISSAYADVRYERRALVIGNAEYSKGMYPLKNSVNDARDINTALEELGFKTDLVLNAGKEGMDDAVMNFCKKIKRDKTKIVFFYYAGHGVSVDGINYLIPVGLKNLNSYSGVTYNAVNALWIVDELHETGADLKIIVLDSCRDIPVFSKTRSPEINISLSEMNCPSGTIIAYASRGQAYDYLKKSDTNGVYARFLKKNLKNPSYSVREVFHETSKDVQTETRFEKNIQEPPVKYIPTDDYYLSGQFKKNDVKTAEIKTSHKEKKTKKGFTNFLNMDFVWIKPGTFMMGSPESEPGRDSDENLHTVRLTRGFFMQTTEVTQGQYKAIMGDNPSYFKDCGDDCPVERVSWNMADKFINKLNKVQDKYIYSLPTEAQWEYCARAGTKTAYSWGDGADCSKANYGNGWSSECKDINPGKTMIVKSYHPNDWGLYDMHGNVWELCKDRYGKYPSGIVIDPVGSMSGTSRVCRGGSWFSYAGICRSALRGYYVADLRDDFLGFRLVAVEAGR